MVALHYFKQKDLPFIVPTTSPDEFQTHTFSKYPNFIWGGTDCSTAYNIYNSLRVYDNNFTDAEDTIGYEAITGASGSGESVNVLKSRKLVPGFWQWKKSYYNSTNYTDNTGYANRIALRYSSGQKGCFGIHSGSGETSGSIGNRGVGGVFYFISSAHSYTNSATTSNYANARYCLVTPDWSSNNPSFNDTLYLLCKGLSLTVGSETATSSKILQPTSLEILRDGGSCANLDELIVSYIAFDDTIEGTSQYQYPFYDNTTTYVYRALWKYTPVTQSLDLQTAFLGTAPTHVSSTLSWCLRSPTSTPLSRSTLRASVRTFRSRAATFRAFAPVRRRPHS
jgi:hypothetical protein